MLSRNATPTKVRLVSTYCNSVFHFSSTIRALSSWFSRLVFTPYLWRHTFHQSFVCTWVCAGFFVCGLTFQGVGKSLAKSWYSRKCPAHESFLGKHFQDGHGGIRSNALVSHSTHFYFFISSSDISLHTLMAGRKLMTMNELILPPGECIYAYQELPDSVYKVKKTLKKKSGSKGYLLSKQFFMWNDQAVESCHLSKTWAAY